MDRISSRGVSAELKSSHKPQKPEPQPNFVSDMAYKSRFGQRLLKQHYVSSTDDVVPGSDRSNGHNDSDNLSGYLKQTEPTERQPVSRESPSRRSPPKFSKRYLDYIQEFEKQRHEDAARHHSSRGPEVNRK